MRAPEAAKLPHKHYFLPVKQVLERATGIPNASNVTLKIFNLIYRGCCMENEGNRQFTSALLTTGMAAACLLAGCNSGPKYPNSKPNVTSSLAQDRLSNLTVSQDRDRGVITLTGTVPSEQKKLQAEDIAKAAAPKYKIADETTVVPHPSAVVTAKPSDTDVAIQDKFNQEVKQHHFLDRPGDNINVKSTNGDVVLSGKVRTQYDKREADKLAKLIPNVQEVENDLNVG
jgi:hyperosmotically inducible periplasmic protein